MPQVIEVRFLHPNTGEELHDCFTKATTHEEAIRLALDDFSGEAGKLKRAPERDPKSEQGAPAGSGANRAWRYVYHCVLEDPENPGGEGLLLLTVLFATYKERE